MELPKRKPNRLKNYDYAKGAFFITICTANKRCILSEIIKDDLLNTAYVPLTNTGKIAERFINDISKYYIDADVVDFVIMPNHVHLIIKTSGSDIKTIIGQFKRLVSKECGESIWQKSFYDHIIRNEEDFIEKLQYIKDNPMKWETDDLYT